jgi:hypothetical protein
MIAEPIRLVIGKIIYLGIIQKDRVNRGLLIHFSYGVCDFLTSGLADAALEL